MPPVTTTAHSTAHIPDQWVYYGLLGLLVWAPLPLASNRIWAVGILLAWALALLAGAIYSWRHHPSLALSRLRDFRWPLMLLGAYVLLTQLQSLPLPGAWLAALSPESYRVQSAAGLAEAGLAYRLSIDPYHSRLYASLSVVYFIAFLVAALTLRQSQRIERLAEVLVWCGLAHAVLGAVLYSFEAQYRLFFTEVSHDKVIGTFVNRNHFAGYMELCLAVGIGLMLSRLGNGSAGSQGWRHRLVAALRFLISPKMRLRLMLVIMVIALVLTRSRMGNTAFFSAMLIVGVIALILSRRMAPATLGLIASLVIIDIFIIGTWVGVEKVVQRIQNTPLLAETGETGLPEAEPAQTGRAAAAIKPPTLSMREQSLEERAVPAAYSLGLIRDFAAFGSGGGSFYNAFSRYRPAEIDLFYDHAHNDYAEIAADTGVLGLLLLGGVTLLAAGRALWVLARRRSPLARGMAFAVLMAIVALAIHNTVDFNLQIPANALTFTVILAMAWCVALLPRGSHKHALAPASPA
ncbi:O-antigen ligase-like membrane protein [Sulfuritortus calidifontis]|uniref:O-antigen ligase-like membrane protein n=1 Tax=Sulfuritortus calidifontis TaxID=1914471 RepID=A0A4R3JVC9_9PROT|nr:O-antigen ligase family protein [Sulfuritortus calidifontis]TCS71929.1 O-antigen ligase-like membrane protein [Sulfuritortus calidifontis]